MTMDSFDSQEHDGAYRMILADPPWHHDQNLGHIVRHPGRVYAEQGQGGGTMTTEEIASIPVHRWAQAKSALVMFTTWPHLFVAMTVVMPRWGFEYRTGFPWVKQFPTGAPRRGGGTWIMQCSEPVIIGVRGNFPVKTRVEELRRGALGLAVGPEGYLLTEKPARHSRKPYEVHDWMEQFEGPHLELFATETRPGWTAWGKETGFILGPAGVFPFTAKPKPQGDLFDGR